MSIGTRQTKSSRLPVPSSPESRGDDRGRASSIQPIATRKLIVAAHLYGAQQGRTQLGSLCMA